MKQGARNDIPAHVVAIERGSVMAQVEARIVGTDDRITSVMILDSLDEPDLKDGETVHVHDGDDAVRRDGRRMSR